MSDNEFAENYCFSTGLLITTINGSGAIINYTPYHTGTATTDYDVKFKMQYIQIPLSIKLKTDEQNDMKWFGQFGLTTDFRISAKQDVQRANQTIADNVNASDFTNFFRAGMIIGGGAEYRLSGKNQFNGRINL
jgi:hypothetical protein